MSSTVAPGMEISYIVKFSPESKIDYSYDLNVLTEREKFVVPIRAIGCKAIVEFPDILEFGRVPVKHETIKPVIISNIGEKATKWQFQLPANSCFTAKQTEGILEMGQSEQLQFKFAPTDVKNHIEKAILSYDNLEAEVLLKGESFESKVFLSKDNIRMNPTYVGLTYCDFVEIVNDGNVAVEFSWRSARSEKEERDKRDKLIKNLEAEEAAERVVLEEAQFEESEEESLDSDDSYDEDELNKKRERKAKKKKDVIVRNYTSMKANLANEVLFFNEDNDTFKIEPQSGKIWPKSKVMISLNFTPKTASEVLVDAYCHVTCCEERLKLQLFGTGLGPEAKVLPSSWSLNDVSVGEQVSQKFVIYNQGQIPFHFAIKPNNTAFGRLFDFKTTEGYLETAPPNNQKEIRVDFISKKVGDFAERFEIQMGKDVNPLIFTCEGKVIAPPMKFEENELDFKKVPFGFDEVKEVTLTNLANVDINFEIEIPDEMEKRTFIPENVPKVINKLESVKIKVRFCPQREGDFAASLTVKVPDVAQDFATLPLKGVCQRPTIELMPTDSMDFGEVYLRKAKKLDIVLVNNSDLKGRYKSVSQEEVSMRLAKYTITPEDGEIKPRSRCEVSISLEAQMRGNISVPLYLNVSSKSVNERLMLKANVLGPKVAVDSATKEFKDVKVLSKGYEHVTIHNISEIAANFTAFTREKNSVFKVDPRTGILQPDEKKELTIHCIPDDAQTFEDTLYVDIADGEHSEVKLRARATGTCICIPGYDSVQQDEGTQKLPAYHIDFGTHYINFDAIKTINIENRGRRKQTIRFESLNASKKSANAKKEKGKENANASPNSPESKRQKEEEEEEPKPVFTIDAIDEEKGTILLEPQHGFTLNCRARSKNVVKGHSEGFRCLAGTDGTRKEECIFIVYFKGNFILPVLTFSEQRLSFKYIWQGEHKSEPIVRDLEIGCESDDKSKGASFRLNLPMPFRIKEPIERLALAPGQKRIIQIEFDPSLTEGRTCRNVPGSLDMIFDRDKGGWDKPNHSIPLEGELCFPNLELSPSFIDFKCILLDTSKKEYLTLKNTKELPVKYHWEFYEEVSDVIQEEPEDESHRKTRRQTHQQFAVNELFDILPISGVLNAGETETVEVTFHALTRNPKPARARCVVEGGPEYNVKFTGEGAEIIEPVIQDKLVFEGVPYCEEAKESFSINNQGKVAFKYFVSLEKVSRPEMFKIERQSGLIAPGGNEKIEVRLKPCLPEEIHEELLVYVAHLEPKRIQVTAVGTFPFLVFAALRSEKDKFARKVEEMEHKISKSKQSLCLQPIDDIKNLLTKKPDNMGKSQMSQMVNMLKPQVAEIEAEVDRINLCEIMKSVFL